MSNHLPTETTEITFVRTVSTGVLHSGDEYGAFCSSTRRAVAVTDEVARATTTDNQCTKCFGTDGNGPTRVIDIREGRL